MLKKKMVGWLKMQHFPISFSTGFVLICTSLFTPWGSLFSFSQFFYVRVMIEYHYEHIGAMPIEYRCMWFLLQGHV